ncbi:MULTISPECIES: nitroreductase family protein [unclassified Paenibacillus]|uniref:nitroreductase family protein n=1 Tax=unclassified Paenibacillus TaxID=185978 RepID=UPI002473A5CE|nr:MULTISPECIES: nitroreductase family protein [unclassified Paenibacillus]MDH6426871.1 putative oxidoreductase (fatty acid repression mutant protein) [Paenibacillus sp. PastH-4]MDH6442899.1 putative oxidoreductase (fatty acid repression mutant protein) [Paenibacillus sp. PastF-4]MDH6526393.1 putative oxidoreductase (fatty acid repression mutant protein) [Paenibacillus sp. PastH-3]
MSNNFFEAVKGRRSIYALSKESPISDAQIVEIVEQAVLHSPTSFNSQSSRAVVLLGEQHDKLWDITTETLRKIVPAEQFEGTAQKLASFKAGYGSVLFFEDQTVVKSLQENFALYAENFPIWANQSSGILQFVVWTALSEAGVGASLQHYNPLIDDEVKEAWGIPQEWKLIAQLPFGKTVTPAGEKQFQPIEDRVKVFK